MTDVVSADASGKDANFDGLETELDYIRKHRPDVPVVVLATGEASE